ncbi:hypothetical protein MFLAVUS_006855 [Mucor flavus]|uniref:3-hydroxyisobutyryl-CoA hydrolase n=1 Tax=Mucor flavus TaxID=439312 RepID=A0ABP9Z2N5_9FUNG
MNVGSVCSFGVNSRFNVATENTKVLLPETWFGHFCDVGANFFLTRPSRNIWKYIALTAQMIRAKDVLLSGLATHFVPSNKLEYLEDSLINLEKPNDDTIRKAIENFAIRPDDVPVSNIMQALEKEGSEFSLSTMNEICQGSPISVALTLEQLRRGSKMSFVECLEMERNSWRISPYQPDFYEGVVSTIIKKKKPQWSRSSHLDVDFEKDVLATYFGNKIN